MKPKLLILTTTFPRWKNDPDPPFVYELAKRLTETFAVTVHTPHYSDALKKEIMDGIQVHRFRYFWEPLEKLAGNTGILPTLRGNKFYLLLVPFLLGAQLCSLFFLILRSRPDVIHAHWVLPQGLAAACVNFFFNIPFVVTAHGADIYSLQGKFLRWLKCIVIKQADIITAVSNPLADTMHSLYSMSRGKIHVLPMGVSSEFFNPAAGNLDVKKKFNVNKELLLYVGRLSEKKGVSYLIEAMPKVLSVFPNLSLLIVGHGELFLILQEQVKKLGITNHVLFAGPIPNEELSSFFASADVFVGPSIQTKGGDTEGFGLTFVEAAMSGCLLIGTDVGGIGDIIIDNETGLLVAEKNSGALADKIIYALENEEKMKKIKITARKQCLEKFDWNVILKRYTELLSQALIR